MHTTVRLLLLICPLFFFLSSIQKLKILFTLFSGTVRPRNFNPSHAAIKISINATAAEFICKNIFPTPVQIKKIIKNKVSDIQQMYLYQNVCK